MLSTSGRSNRSASSTARSAASIEAWLSPITPISPASSASTRASSGLGPNGSTRARASSTAAWASRPRASRPSARASMRRRVALAQRVAQLPPERQGLTPHELGLGRLVDDPELGGERIEDLGPGPGVDGAVLAGPQGQSEVGEGLAVRRELGGTSAGRPRVPQRRHVVARSVRVEGEPGVVIAPGCRECGEDPRVEVGAPRLGHGIRHGEAGDLVPEPQLAAVGDEQPRIEDRRRTRRPGRRRRPTGGGGRRAGRPGRRRRAGCARRTSRGATRAITASRADAGSRVPPEPITSATKYGLPPVRACTSAASRRVPATSCATAVRDSGGRVTRRVARWRESSPRASRRGGEAADSSSRKVTSSRARSFWMRRPVCRRRSRVASSAQCTSSTDEDGQAVGGADGLDERGEQRVAGGVGAEGLEQRAADVVGDVAQGGEGEGREQAVARAPVPRGVGQPGLDLLEQRGLADPGLTLDQDEATGSGIRLGRVGEHGLDLAVTVHELHRVHRQPPGRRVDPAAVARTDHFGPCLCARPLHGRAPI